MFWHKKPEYMMALAELLANGDNRESFLGVKETVFPTAKQVRDDAARLARYSDSKDYLIFVEEVWARILGHLDTILDDKTTYERVQFHRGALKSELDLLRVSYTARSMVAKEAEKDASLQR